MRVLSVLGQYQYGRPELGEGTEFANFLPAFKALGHEVHHFESWNKGRYADFAELNTRLVERVLQITPDVLFVVPLLYEVWIETLATIRSTLGVPIVMWMTDDSWKYNEASRFLANYADVVLTTDAGSLAKYRKDGFDNARLVQWAASHEGLQAPTPFEECEIDVSFVGAAHGDRKQKVDSLRNLGVAVECFGHGWPNGSVSTSDLRETVRKSRISLNFANSRGHNQLKARAFEVPGAGGLLVSEEMPGIAQWYRLGEEIVVAPNLQALAKASKDLLADPGLRDSIAWRGYLRTRADHTYYRRFEGVFESVASKARTHGVTEVLAARSREQIRQAAVLHVSTPIERALGRVASIAATAALGRSRGGRAARRLLFEISWRTLGERTYSARGLPGKLFYRES